MNIVVLDGNALNPGDLSWQKIAELGEFKVYPRTSADLIYERAFDAEIILLNKVPLQKEMIERLRKLKYVGLLSTGTNVVDLEACAKRNITVCNIPSYSTFSVTQMTFALILEMAVGVRAHSDSVKRGEWAASADFCYWKQNIVELFGKTIGIVGYGQIGRQVAIAARAFGMRVVVYSRHMDINQKGEKENQGDLEFVTLEQLYKQSDIISLHCPLNSESVSMINKDSIKIMKDGATIVNTARGGLVDEDAAACALKSGKLLGYACDVLKDEPPKADNPLVACANSVVTPHIGWASLSARQRLMDIAYSNLKAFLHGGAENKVN